MNGSSVIAVTGATGFLGSYLTERLVREGARVRLLARDPAKAARFREAAETIAIGDINDRGPLARIMDRVDAVFHLVSNFRSTSDSPSQYHATNLEGTLAALDVAQAAGVRRFVHCSTIGVHGDVQHTPADETAPYAPGDLYQETKVLAERACLERAARGRMEIVIVRPCSIYGPGDLRMLKMFKMLARRTFIVLQPCDANFHAVYIDDLVEGFVRALHTPDIAGQSFIIGGPEYVPLREYIDAAARAVGVPAPALRLPYGVMDAAAGICERLCVPLRISRRSAVGACGSSKTTALFPLRRRASASVSSPRSASTKACGARSRGIGSKATCASQATIARRRCPTMKRDLTAGSVDLYRSKLLR